jgi:hypothetical protein
VSATRAPTERERLHGWAQREVIRGALDAEVLERAAMIVRLRSRRPAGIISRAVCKVLRDMAAR